MFFDIIILKGYLSFIVYILSQFVYHEKVVVIKYQENVFRIF